MSGTWATTPTACRDAADPGWADAPTACRDRSASFTGTDAGLGIEVDGGVDDGSAISLAGWYGPIVRSCRDGS